MKKVHLVVYLILISTFRLYGQEFGGFPPSVKWRQINTDTARIIFPAAADSQAQEIAAIIHRITTQRPNSLGNHLRKIDVVLHNNTTIANGYVALAPFRSEYYLIPGSDIFEFGANPWHKELAVHEYRHVLQYSNFNTGLSKFASILFGQGGQALFNALSIPGWFWEGDAVHSETTLTPQGRGRTPYFFNGYKALWREGRNYSWMKLRNGSLKDFVPTHYHLGYLLVNYGYLKYGDDFWRKVTSDAAAFKGVFYPFQYAVKKHSGVNYKTFRKEALQYYGHEVSRKRTDIVKQETVTNYYFPQYIGNDSLLYLKGSYRSLKAFYIKDKNGEHKLRLRNLSTEDWLSYRNGVIAYTGYEPNSRWSLIDYSSIYLYNIHTGKQKKITAKEKYFTPDISPSGKKIIAVAVNEKTETVLHVLDTDGNMLKEIKSTNHSYFNHPRFIDENNIAITERLPNSTMQMSRIDLTTGDKEVLIPSTSALLGYPFVHDGSVFFVSSVAGMDDIYALRLSDKKVFEVVSGVTGKYYPSVYNDSLVWSSFTSNGLHIDKKVLSGNGEEKGSQVWREVTLPYPIANETSANILAGGLRKFSVKKYSTGAHLFNFHSWNPDYTDPEFTLSLFSDNVLGNFTNEIYYRYNQNETSNTVGFTSFYGGLFPVLNAGLEYTANRTLRTINSTINVNQLEAKIGYNIPLNFSGGRMYRYLDFGSDFVYNQTRQSGKGLDSLKDNFTYLRHFISWSHYLPSAKQHIYPRFGYAASVNLRHVINSNFGGTLANNSQWLLGAQLFLPSFKNHSIVVSASYQRVDTNSTRFSNRFSNSRGYEDYYFRKAWRVSGNYHFPIVYPDFGLANVVYLQRVRGNIFYDFTKAYGGYFARDAVPLRNLRSTGAEIFFDTKFWNELPISFGVRASYLLDNGFSPADRKGKLWFDLALPLDLIPD